MSTSEKPNLSIPMWGHLLPAGPQIEARDGRKWTFDAAEIVAAFRANGAPLPVDYEHGQDLAAPKGLLAPAAGWIEELDVRDGAIWVRIEWTERAGKLITDRAYRFLSASMRTTPDNRVLSLRGAALVNRPALRVEPLQTEPDEAETAREASRLICLAREHLAEQTALGRKLTLTDAILSMRDCAHDLPHLPQDRKEPR